MEGGMRNKQNKIKIKIKVNLENLAAFTPHEYDFKRKYFLHIKMLHVGVIFPMLKMKL